MKVRLRNPERVVEVVGPKTVRDILRTLEIVPESVLVIHGDDLVTGDRTIDDDAEIEVRPVISGGAR